MSLGSDICEVLHLKELYAGIITIKGSISSLIFNETDAVSGDRVWRVLANSSIFSISPRNDANTSGASALEVDRDRNVTITNGFFGLGAATELTIATGVVTAVRSYHRVDTEADAATDDLDTINGGSEGDILIIRPESGTRTVVAKDGVGNMFLEGDFTMDNSTDILTVLNLDGNNWVELSRSNNGA